MIKKSRLARYRRLLLGTSVTTFLLGVCISAALARPIGATTFDELKFRYLGPSGNKVLAAAGVPGNPEVIYAGTASGGVFKSTDDGSHWKAIFDNARGISSIGAIAVAQSSPNIIWIGTGEGEIRLHVAIGDGVYKSTDAGVSWAHMGLRASGHIARIAVDPRDPNRVFVAVIGRGYAPQEERGLFRTLDGGRTWKRVLFVNSDTGAADVVIDPLNSNIVFASTWQMKMGPAGIVAGGPGSGIYRSMDGGDTWLHLVQGLPTGALGRIGLGTSARNPRIVYATIGTTRKGAGSLWVSENGGDTWTLRSSNGVLSGGYVPNGGSRAMYFSHMGVFPDDSNEIYFLAQSLYRTTDGGVTITKDGRVFPDSHDIWFDPSNPRRIIIADDRFVVISEDRGVSWRQVDLPNAQMQSLGVDHAVPYNLYGARRDGSGFKVPSNSRVAPEQDIPGLDDRYPITPSQWTTLPTPEEGVTYPDPRNDDLVWMLSPYGLNVLHQSTGQVQELFPWPAVPFWQAYASRFRVSGYALAVSAHLPEKIYAGSQYVHESDDIGQTWRIISPDLTGNSLKPPSGPWVLQFDGTIRSEIQVLAESPIVAGMLWTGSNDGVVYMRRDDASDWMDASRGLAKAGVGAGGVITSIEPSHTRLGTAYLTVDRDELDDYKPYVLKTDDYGAHWRLITRGIPESVVSYALVVREDPRRPGLLYLGTEGGLYISSDDGSHWSPLGCGLPRVPVSGIVIQEPFNDIAVSTYGRGMWTLDDATPMQDFTQGIAAREFHLFSTRPTYIFDLRMPPGAGDLNTDFIPPSNGGEDPPQGAALSYYLKSSVKMPVIIEIRDSQGGVVRTLKVGGDSGIHRVWWLFDRDGDEGKPPWSRRLIAPGLYDVSMHVGKLVQDTPLTLMQDPRGPRRQPTPNDSYLTDQE